MPKSYSLADARSHLAEIVDEAEAGRDVELTRRGKKVAVVVSAAKYARIKSAGVGFAEAYDRFVRRFDLEKVGVDETWAEGLRDRDVGRGIKL